MHAPSQTRTRRNFDSRAKKVAATDSIENLFTFLLQFFEILTFPLSDYCHSAFLESSSNFEHFRKRTS